MFRKAQRKSPPSFIEDVDAWYQLGDRRVSEGCHLNLSSSGVHTFRTNAGRIVGHIHHCIPFLYLSDMNDMNHVPSIVGPLLLGT